MTGYSGTPLARKLGIKEGHAVAFVNDPPELWKELTLPADVRVVARPKGPLDLILFFTKSRAELEKKFSGLAAGLAPAGMLWIAWPKKSSGVATDLVESIVQRIGLDAGLVDTKVCAINETWSGLKFVIRVAERREVKSQTVKSQK